MSTAPRNVVVKHKVLVVRGRSQQRTIYVSRREHDGLNCRYGWQNQGGCQARIPKPFGLAKGHTGGDKNIVENLDAVVSLVLSLERG